MKKLFISILFCVTCIHAFSLIPGIPMINIKWDIRYTQPWGGGKPFPKSPVLPPEAPEATLENNVLTFTSTHDDYTLTLLDEDGEVAYQVVVPSTVNIVVLPTTLSGEFELQLSSGDNYYFYCDIEL